MRASKNRAKAKEKADKYFAAYIRKRDEKKPCITCGSRTPDKDCGHFISRRFEATRFDEKNAHGQCKRCNRFENGRQFEHGQKIDEIYGEGTAASLHRKSKMACHRKKHDYEYIAELYNDKLKELA